MISKKGITKNLKELDALYQNARGHLKPQLYAKLAIIEVSGWIEECVDSIVNDLSDDNLLLPKNINQYKNDTIKKNSGFQYEFYIRNRLMKDLIGIVLIERIESILSADPKFIRMVAALQILTTIRNENAHTHISGITPNLIAPSVTSRYFQDVYDGLTILNRRLRKIKFK